MSIVVVYSESSSPSSDATTPASGITACAARKLRNELASTSDELLAFTDDVQLDMLRRSRWQFLESAPKFFITEAEQSDYWIGTTGSNPAGTVDTGLNLGDFDKIKDNSVMDRSNYRLLPRVLTNPNHPSLQFQSGAIRPGVPAVFRHDPQENQHILSLYPAPDKNNTFEPVPPAPIVKTSDPGLGTVAVGFYYVGMTFTDTSGGESTVSKAARIYHNDATAGIVVKAPKLPQRTFTANTVISQYKVYAGTSETNLKLSGAATAIASDHTITAVPAGANPPSTSSLEPMGGYVIEFRYFKERPVIDGAADVLMIPDVYRDIVCDGVAARGFQWLRHPEEAAHFYSLYTLGLQTMVRDRNLHPTGPDFISPAGVIGGTYDTSPLWGIR